MTNHSTPGPLAEHDLAQQWNTQADEFNQWGLLDTCEQLACAQARAIAVDRNRRSTIQSASVALTDEKLLRLAKEWNSGLDSIEFEFIVDYARAVLALAQPEPEPECSHKDIAYPEDIAAPFYSPS
jgi:hypothetical protein